jgi:hypothetical protein
MKMLHPKLRYDSIFNENLDKLEKSGMYVLETKYAKVEMVDENDLATKVRFLSIEQALQEMRLSYPTYSEDQLLDMLDSQSSGYFEIPQNFAFGYSITAHKSQGGTYKHVFVDEENMSYRDDKRKMYKSKQFFGYEANSMRYVGFSRPTTGLFILTKKPIGDKLILSNGKEYSSEIPTFDKILNYTAEQKEQIINNIISQFKDKNYSKEDVLDILDKALAENYESAIDKINNCYL